MQNTLIKILNFFKTFNFKKATLVLLNPLILMYNNYYHLFIGLFIIIMIDLRFGIRAYCKTNNQELKLFKPSTWHIIQSSGIRKTLSKLKDYLFLTIAVFFLETYMFKGHDVTFFGYSITHICFLILAAVELWSIGEKFKKIRGYNIIEMIINLFVKKDIEKVTDTITNSEEDEQG